MACTKPRPFMPLTHTKGEQVGVAQDLGGKTMGFLQDLDRKGNPNGLKGYLIPYGMSI